MRMARMFPQSRAWPPGPDEIFLARDSLSLLDVAVGDTVTVEPARAAARQLRIADTVYDPSLSPSPQEQTARGYVSTAVAGRPRPSWTSSRSRSPSRRTRRPAATVTQIVAIAGEVGPWLQDNHDLKIREIQVPRPYTHPHQWQADALLAALLAGAAASAAAVAPCWSPRC